MTNFATAFGGVTFFISLATAQAQTQGNCADLASKFDASRREIYVTSALNAAESKIPQSALYLSKINNHLTMQR